VSASSIRNTLAKVAVLPRVGGKTLGQRQAIRRSYECSICSISSASYVVYPMLHM